MTRTRLLRAVLCLLAAYILWFCAVPAMVRTRVIDWPQGSWPLGADLASQGAVALSAIALWYFAPRLSGAPAQAEDRPWQDLGMLFLAGWAFIEFFSSLLNVLVNDTYKLLAGYYFVLALVLAIGWRNLPGVVMGLPRSLWPFILSLRGLPSNSPD